MSRQKIWLFSFINLLLLALLSVWLWMQNQATEIAVPQHAENQKLQCASYAPYYTKGQSPFIKGTHISREQIDHDLALLAERFDCVRTYSVEQGLDYVPEAASKLGLEVLLGVWIGWTDLDNNRELTLGLKLANQYPEVVRALIVGNEVLLRKEQPIAKMQAYLKRAQESTDVPITYADVWEFWLKNRALEDSVDYITAHILPYWEDEPQSIEEAIPHADTVMTVLGSTFTKPIFIGETGWPSIGRHRNGSAPSQVNQARYIREFLQIAHEQQWNYNLIEAFDQPWKRVLEGTVGGHWGLYDTQLEPKFSLTDPVPERKDGWWPWLFAVSGILIFSLMAYLNRATNLNLNHAARVLAFLPLGAAAGLLSYLQLGYLMAASRDIYEWIILGGISMTGWIGIFAIPSLVLSGNEAAKNWIRVSIWALGISAFICISLLLADGRYRDFPISLFLLPCIGRLRKDYLKMTITALIGIVIFLCIEPLNIHAWAWLALNLLLLSSGLHKNHSFSPAAVNS
jgi:exo-beta-1,3-glucanase (GH17 family)